MSSDGDYAAYGDPRAIAAAKVGGGEARGTAPGDWRILLEGEGADAKPAPFPPAQEARLREIVREEIACSAQIAEEQRVRRAQLARQRNAERYSEGSS